MKTQEFSKNFEIDRSARGIRAVERRIPPPVLEYKTGDNEVYDPGQNYFFFDLSRGEVFESKTFRQREGWLVAMGLKIIEISKLRKTKDLAVEDQQKYLVSEVSRIREQIQSLENNKTPSARTLKYILMARG